MISYYYGLISDAASPLWNYLKLCYAIWHSRALDWEHYLPAHNMEVKQHIPI